jgi:hypothetical protein
MIVLFRLGAILLFLVTGSACVWSKTVVHVKEPQALRDKTPSDFEKFEHPEDSFIEDLGALAQPQQRCQDKRRRLRSR